MFLTRISKIFIPIAVFLLLMSLFTQAVLSMRLKSATYDEPLYLSAGYSYIKAFNTRIDRDRPPLVKVISALPLLFLNPTTPPDHFRGHPTYGHQFLYHCNNDADQILFYGRVPTVLLSILLGLFVFRWAKELYGSKSGLLALFLYVFDPNILGHSGLATLDIAATCFIFISIYSFWKFLKNPTKKSLFVAGVAFGLAQAAKFTAILLFPIFLILLLSETFFKGQSQTDQRSKPFSLPIKKGFISLILIFLIGYFIVFLTYGFQLRPVINPDIQTESVRYHIDVISNKLSFFGEQWTSKLFFIAEQIPIPARDYFIGLYNTISYTSLGHPSFLMGEHSNSGWWYYFIIAFLIKTPIPTLIFLMFTFLSLQKSMDKHIIEERFLLIPIFIIFAIASHNRVNIGLRHILPIYPLLFVFISRITNLRLKGRGLPTAISIIFLSLCYLLSTISIYPHYLAYFNEFIGGPDQGYKYLVDSNLDWGQDLKGLKLYMKKNGIDKVKLAYFGESDPDYYKIPHEPIPYPKDYWIFDKPASEVKQNPAGSRTNGIIAISATLLQGTYVDDKEYFNWLKEYEPIAKIGYSIFIYNVPK